MNLPPMIAFVNGDIDGYTLNTLSTQLFIDGYIPKSEFDARVAALPDYPSIVHANNLRIIVILPDFRDYTNRELADVVIFVKNGLANIEKNKYGPPKYSLTVERINIYDLLRYGGSKYVITLPCYGKKPRYWMACDCFPHDQYHKCGCHKVLGGIYALQSRDVTGVHLPNCDNIFNNEAFINRK